MKPLRLALLLSLTITGFACGGASSDADSTETIISTALSDDSIELDSSTAPAGTLVFDVGNDGSVVHEIEVFAGSETDLPVDLGVADTSGLSLIDEIEDIIPGGNVSLKLDLPAGDYVIICNLPGHYLMGMVTKLTVTS